MKGKHAIQLPPQKKSNNYLIFNRFFDSYHPEAKAEGSDRMWQDSSHAFRMTVAVIATLLLSSSAFAFGGGGSGRTNRFYERHAGVDALGIHRHIDKDEQADIKFNCDDPNASPNMQGVCECNEGYEMQEGACVIPTPQPITCTPCEDLVEEQCVPRTCGDNMHCDTEQDQCVCDEGYEPDGQGGCKESCPEERQCGETCCGEGLECNTDNTCTVCTNGNVYLSYMDDHCGTTELCPGESGYTYTYTHDCISNKDCSLNEYCSSFGNSASNTHFTCKPIGDYVDITMPDQKKFRASTEVMSYWGAENWCKAQKMNLIDIEDMYCYQSNSSTMVTNHSNGYVYCCIGNNQTCSDWNSYWDGNTIKPEYENFVNTHYSPYIATLRTSAYIAMQGAPLFQFWSQGIRSNELCHILYPNTNIGGVDMVSRNDFIRALCK